MMLKGKTAIVYGAGGAIGRAVATAFAVEGASVYLAGRTLASLEETASEIRALGGRAETAQVDALDREAVEEHIAQVEAQTGRIDISFNAIRIRGDLQGTPLLEMSEENFTAPVLTGVRTHFLTASAAGRYMVKRGSGVILTLSASSGTLSGRDRRFYRMGGFAVACSAIESLTRSLAGELGPEGVRVLCLRSDAIPETWSDRNADVRKDMTEGTALNRLPTLAQIADAAVFAASGRSAAMTGTVLNLTCGSIMD